MSDVPDPFYPAWRFHPTLPMKIVQSAAEDGALDKDWVHTPSELPQHGPAPEPAPPPKEPPPAPDLTPDQPSNEPGTTAAPKKSHHKKKEPAAGE